ncbi:tryptophan 7-halogenase [Amycolatopsis panacis]|uniref:FAD-binding protein n=1 Tax=Amycolatopsis panacis TaxID=2340917 RepID=A0A419HJ98_9PSEU|nr:tryptophan 7-halogenase [Amycolatopsis panacis]RJQ75872.1 FAD-binding protein [Amycolatopsis panacis]
MSAEEEFDVVVAGGGPGGSTVASFVAMQGHRVLLLEKEAFPRYQIGESLLPATVHGICGLLGVSAEIEKAGFVRKLGGTFRWGTSPEPWSFSFAISPRMAGPTSHAYQVERMKFDDILLKHARKVGVDVREQCAVAEVTEDAGRASGVVYTDSAGTRHEVAAKFVVDASGNKSRIHRAAGGERAYSDFFRNIALFGYFEGAKRLPEPRKGNIFCAAFDEGWFWYIPLSDRLTSVGAVVSREFAESVQGDSAEALSRLIVRCPRIADLLSDAERVTEGAYGEVRVRKDYSYRNSRFWRPGMVLVGDAACFVDPVFSSGVHLATYSALLAARSLNSVLAGEVDEERSFAEFEARYRHEYSLFYEFLVSFYDMNSDHESYFWQAKRVTNFADSELEAFVELVGGVASLDGAFVDVESARARFKHTAGELESSVSEVDRSGGDDATALYQSAIMGHVMEQGTQVQAHAVLGGELDAEDVFFPGGLLPSADGLRWVVPAE